MSVSVCMDTRLIDCGDLKTKVRVSFIVQATLWGQNINKGVGTSKTNKGKFPQTTKQSYDCMYVCRIRTSI